MPQIKDSGSTGELISLAGVRGKAGLGLNLDYNTVPIPTSVNTQVLQANPARKWAVLHNINDSDITVFFGDVAAAGIAGIRLPKYGTLILNKDLMWSGSMTAFQDSGATINMFSIEASIQQ